MLAAILTLLSAVKNAAVGVRDNELDLFRLSLSARGQQITAFYTHKQSNT